MTVKVMWEVPAWGLTFQLPQQTLIIIIASQGEFTKCSSFQTGHLFEAIFSLIILIHFKTSSFTHIFKLLPESKVIIFLITCFFNFAPEIVTGIEEKRRKFLKQSLLDETLLLMLITMATKTSVKL